MKKSASFIPRAGRRKGAAAQFVDEKLSLGSITFTISELTRATGLSSIAARNQLLRLGARVARVAPRQEFFVIVSPEQRAMGGPPVLWWLDAYFKWLGRAYYLGLQSAAAEYGAMPRAVQVVQVMTDKPRERLELGRLRVQFFVNGDVTRTLTQPLPKSYAPVIISTPEATCLDLVRYAPRIGGMAQVAETLAQMLPLLSPRRLLNALDSRDDVRTAQRLGYILDTLGQRKLSATLRHRLPARLTKIDLDTYVGHSITEATSFSERWAVLANARLLEST